MGKIIALSNQKGGVAKTATAVNLGVGLARQGYKVLLVDCDPQANLTVSLGYHQPETLPVTFASILAGVMNESYPIPSHGILHHAEGIDLMPSCLELSGVEISLVTAYCRETILRSYLNIVKPCYDFILVDTNPSLGMLTINALAAADTVVIPVEAHYLPVKGLELLLRTISNVQKHINPALAIGGILMTKVDARTNFNRDSMELVKSTYADDIHVFSTRIPFAISAAETSATGSSIFVHDPCGKVAAAYTQLTQEVLTGACRLSPGREVLASA